MGGCLSVLGGCLNAAHMCATHCHDEYMNWKWEREDTFDTSLAEIIQLQNTTKLQRIRSIHTAVIGNNAPEIKRIIEEQPETKKVTNNYGETALHLACKLGYIDSINTLIDHGCPTNICTEIGTPLHCIMKAVQTGYMKTETGQFFLQKLVQNGTDINAMDKGHKTALFLAAENGNYKLIKELLSQGACVNCKDVNGFTPLYMSAIRSDIDCLSLILLSEEVQVDAYDEAGRTPLIASLITIMNNLRYERLPYDLYNIGQPHDNAIVKNRYNRIGIVEALLRAGANPNEKDCHARSSLVIAFVILEMDNIRGIAHQAITNAEQTHTGCRLEKGDFTDTEMIQSSPESVYTSLVRMLVLSGASMPATWDKDDSKSPAWLQLLYSESKRVWTEGLSKKPYRLIHSARISIRACLAKNQNLANIDSLPLPDKLKDYLNVKYY